MLSLVACSTANIVPEDEVFPLKADYKALILKWAKTFYLNPHGIAAARISDPVPIADSTGHKIWLVCVELNPQGPGGAPMGLQRQAFGISATQRLIAPLDRGGTTVSRDDCDAVPLAWRSWPALERL